MVRGAFPKAALSNQMATSPVLLAALVKMVKMVTWSNGVTDGRIICNQCFGFQGHLQKFRASQGNLQKVKLIPKG